MNDAETIANKLLELQEFLYGLLKTERMIHLPKSISPDRFENDTEHSYNLAMLAWYVCGHLPGLDKDKVIRYALVHDLVEIHAGDVQAIGRTDEQQKRKDAREKTAEKRIEAAWRNDFPDMVNALKSYESQKDQEAIFVKSLDKLAPLIHNILGKGYGWKKLEMKRNEIIANKDEKTAKSKEVAEIWKIFKADIMAHPEWFSKGKAN